MPWFLYIGVNFSFINSRDGAVYVSVAGEQRERVLVGPKLDRQRVMDAKSKIDKEFGVDSDVLSCQPQKIEDS